MPSRHLVWSALGALSLSAAAADAPALATPDTTLDTVVVTGKRPAADALEREQALTPGAVTIIDGEDLYERNINNLSDILRYTPGIWSDSPSGADELFLSSRGSNLDATDYDKNGIKLLVDGLPVTTADGNNHNRVLDPLSARYAAVARGANALTYGASTLGGAINFTTPTARDTERLSLFLNGGSHDQLNGRITAGHVAGAFDGLVTLENKRREGYREHSHLDRQGVYANAGWQMSESITTRLYATYVNYDEELPRALTRAQVDDDPDQAAASALTGDNRKRLETARGAIKTTWQIDADSSLEAGLSYEEQALFHPIVDVRGDLDGDGFPETQFFSLLIDTDHRNAGGMLRYNRRVGTHDLLFGVNLGDTHVKGGNYNNLFGRKNGRNQRVKEQADSLEAFAIDRWQFAAAWTLVYGAQVVDTKREVTTVQTSGDNAGDVFNPKGDYSTVNPRLGLIYAVSPASQLFASVSRLYEPPTTFELQDDTRPGVEALDAMKGTVVEVGTRGRAASSERTQWHWDVALYYAWVKDEILSVEDDVQADLSRSTNIDSTIHAGVEALVGASFALDAKAAHRLDPLLSLTLNEFKFDDDDTYGNNDLPAAPTHAVRGELMYRHASGFSAGPTFDLVGRRYADFVNSYKVGSYELLGLRSGYIAKRWEVFAELRNLLDEDYISTLTVRDSAGPGDDVLFPGEPRSVYVGARLVL